ncbi:late embryogenesis abundant protein 47-like [Amaranthus tricolor]|uniref:late embryogenesis abundant protein 47-like n=1 Tax=Amaranthus tricolor TaxID=29722 RepID=UPI0025878D12|nr:late embryogenesis abundant protein 47-like [Amaranthus tricolor]
MAHEEQKPAITIGEALEVVANIVGNKPVDESDAAAIQAAEMRATGATAPPISGIGLQAQAAAMVNARRIYDQDKTTLAEIIGDATEKLESDKPVTLRDAEKVRAAELQGDVEGLIGSHCDAPKETVTPGGVAEAISTAATLNQS